MNSKNKIIDCYNKTADQYADKYINELNEKHLDRILLRAFADENADKGKCIDLGCGPGQTMRYLADCGVKNLTGIDISPAMISVAKKLNPLLDFETGDMLRFKLADNSIGSAIAFYSIVHFNEEEITIAFHELKRVLINEGQLLLSFHIGDEIMHLDNFLGHNVNIDFRFFQLNTIVDLLNNSGFATVDVIERAAYVPNEYPSRRAYIWAKSI